MFTADPPSYGGHMPTAAEFSGAASALGGELASIDAMRAGVEGIRSSPGISGGPVAEAVSRSLVAASSNLSSLVGLVQAAIAELQRRAALCEVYTEEYRAYERRYARWRADLSEFMRATNEGRFAYHPGPAPVPPTKPFPEAEVG